MRCRCYDENVNDNADYGDVDEDDDDGDEGYDAAYSIDPWPSLEKKKKGGREIIGKKRNLFDDRSNGRLKIATCVTWSTLYPPVSGTKTQNTQGATMG